MIKQSGVPSDFNYPYREMEAHRNPYACAYKQSTSIGKVKSFATVKTSNETFIRDVVAKVGPVVVALNSGLKTFIAYK